MVGHVTEDSLNISVALESELEMETVLDGVVRVLVQGPEILFRENSWFDIENDAWDRVDVYFCGLMSQFNSDWIRAIFWSEILGELAFVLVSENVSVLVIFFIC